MISACRLLWPGVTWRLVVTLVLPLLLLPLPLVWRAPGQLEPAEYCDISQISLAALISGVHVLSEARCLYVLLLMAGYWLGELLPIPATALLPVVLFPLLGIMTTAQVLVLSCGVMPYHPLPPRCSGQRLLSEVLLHALHGRAHGGPGYRALQPAQECSKFLHLF